LEGWNGFFSQVPPLFQSWGGEILIPLASPFEKGETTFENFYVFSFEKNGG